VTSFEPGPATFAALTLGSGNRWRIIASRVAIEDFGPLPSLCVPHFKIKPSARCEAFLTAYAQAGGPHHNAVCLGDARRRLSLAAALIGAEFTGSDAMLLGLDLGTTNVKAVVAELDGYVRGEYSVPIALLHVPNGGVEQEIEEIWAVTLARHSPSHPKCGPARAFRLWASRARAAPLQLLDAHHRPLGRVISWLDARGAADDDGSRRELGRQWFVDHIAHGGSALAAGN